MKRLMSTVLIIAVAGGALWVFRDHFPKRRAPDNVIKNAGSDYDGHVIEHFTLEGFGDAGERVWQLQGDVAHVNKDTDVFIEKNVKLQLENATTIESDKVYWRNSRSRFVTKSPVQIIHHLQKIEGTGAEGRLDDDFVQINQNIRMFLDGPVFVTCWGPLKIFRKEKRLTMYRDPVIHDAKGTVRSDRLDVYYDDDGAGGAGKIKQIVARNNVRIQRGENISYSDTAVYNAETQSVRLAGKPKVVIADEALDKYGNI